MRILSPQEGINWLVGNGWSGPSSDSLSYELHEIAHYRLPQDTGKKTVLARTLVELLTDEKDGALWIKGWGAFQSQQNMDLFYGYRRSLGEARLMVEAPFHVCSKSDGTAVESLLDLTLYFYWDALLFKGNRDLVLRTSNDEFFDIYTRSAAKRDETINHLSFLGLAADKESQASVMRRRVLTNDIEPIESSSLEELRRAADSCPQSPALQKCLANNLCNALFFAKEERRQDQYEAFLEELRQLAKKCAQNASVRNELAKGLFYSLSCSIKGGEIAMRNAIVEELRQLASRHPEDARAQEWARALEW